MRSGKSPAGDWASPDKNRRRLGCLKKILPPCELPLGVALSQSRCHTHILNNYKKMTEKIKENHNPKKTILSHLFSRFHWKSLD
jgi:hypothetical protein